MIDAITSIIDRFINLIERRQLARRDYFVSHVEPLFSHLITIHEDYVAEFSDAKALLLDQKTEPKELKVLMLAKKRKLEHIRLLVHALNDCLKTSWYVKSRHRKENARFAYEFIESVVKYFVYGSGEPPPPFHGQTWYSGFIGVIDDWVEGDMDREMCADCAESILKKLPMRWGEVAQKYAKLRGACLGAT